MTLGELAEQVLRVVREAPVIAYDTETSGLDWKINWPVGYVITAPDFNCYIPIRHGGGGNLLDPNARPLRSPDEAEAPQHRWEADLAKSFRDRDRRGFLTVGHHLKFDMHMSARQGIILGRNCEDTGINAPLLDEFARSFSLENCCQSAGVPAKKGKELYDHMSKLFGGTAEPAIMQHFWRLSGDDPVAKEYAMADGSATLGLRTWQIKRIEEEEMQVVHRVESRLIYTVFRVEHRGIKVDLSRLGAVEDMIKLRLDRIRAKFPKDFNPIASSQVRKVLEDGGITNWPMTDASARFPDGQPSFPEKWLKKSPLGNDIVSFRKLLNIGSKFITPLKNEHAFNGRVYSSLNQMKGDEFGTISGRFSSSEPNLQQIPKRDKELSPLFRSIFVPDEGMDFWEGDYSQCEPRLFAHYSKEPALVNGYSSTPFIDMHDVVAQAFGVERDPTAKRMNMGILTGMYPPTFADHMDWTLEKATEEWNKWFALFPGIRDFQNNTNNVFKQTGFVRTLLKRRCRLEHRRFAYRGVSRVIQGGNADILKYKMLEADEWLESEGDQAHLLMSVHDAFEWQAPKGEKGEKLSEELVRIFCDVQTEPFNLRIPFLMDTDHGDNWGVATFGQPKNGNG